MMTKVRVSRLSKKMNNKIKRYNLFIKVDKEEDYQTLRDLRKI